MSKNWQSQIPGGKTQGTSGQPNSTPKQPNTTSFLKTAGGFGVRRIFADYGNGGEVFENFFSVAEEVLPQLKVDAPTSNFTVHRIMKEDYGLNYSGIVIANTEGGVTVYHVILIEATGEDPAPIVRDYGGEPYTILRTPAQAMDETYIMKVEALLSARLGVDKSTLRSVDGSMIFKTFNGTDRLAIERALSNAFNAVFQETLVLVRNFLGEPLSTYVNRPDARFAIDVEFNNSSDMLHDITGAVIRQDIIIKLSTKVGNNNSRSVNQGEVGEELLKITGYIDFEYQMPIPQQAGMPAPTQTFMPNFVVTHWETKKMLMTPHLLVMGIGSLVAISQDMTWVKYFIDKSPVKGKEINLNDIGLLNIQGNLNRNTSGFDEPLKTNDAKLGPNGLWNYIMLLVKPKMMISLDVPSCGANTWFLGIFSHIAARNARARARITEAVNVLIGGGFDDSGVPMFIPNVNKIHGGYYIEKQELYDIRRASSYLAYAAHINSTNQSPELIRRYVSTYQNESIPADIRAAERGKLISESVGNRMEVKQFYDRLTFNGEWLSALVEVLTAAGFRPIPENIRVGGYDAFQQRGFDYDQAGISPNVRIAGRNNTYNSFHNPYQAYNRQY